MPQTSTRTVNRQTVRGEARSRVACWVGVRVDLARKPLRFPLGLAKPGLRAAGELGLGSPNLKYEREEQQMYATHRRYEGIDRAGSRS
jgi:hypothetical protein